MQPFWTRFYTNIFPDFVYTSSTRQGFCTSFRSHFAGFWYTFRTMFLRNVSTHFRTYLFTTFTYNVSLCCFTSKLDTKVRISIQSPMQCLHVPYFFETFCAHVSTFILSRFVKLFRQISRHVFCMQVFRVNLSAKLLCRLAAQASLRFPIPEHKLTHVLYSFVKHAVYTTFQRNVVAHHSYTFFVKQLSSFWCKFLYKVLCELLHTFLYKHLGAFLRTIPLKVSMQIYAKICSQSCIQISTDLFANLYANFRAHCYASPLHVSMQLYTSSCTTSAHCSSQASVWPTPRSYCPLQPPISTLYEIISQDSLFQHDRNEKNM